jgi:hypothetical protein
LLGLAEWTKVVAFRELIQNTLDMAKNKTGGFVRIVEKQVELEVPHMKLRKKTGKASVAHLKSRHGLHLNITFNTLSIRLEIVECWIAQGRWLAVLACTCVTVYETFAFVTSHFLQLQRSVHVTSPCKPRDKSDVHGCSPSILHSQHSFFPTLVSTTHLSVYLISL